MSLEFCVAVCLMVAVAASGCRADGERWAEIISPDAKVEKLAGGFLFTEGPVWHPDGYLLFSDCNAADAIMKWTPGIGVTTFRKPAGPPNGLTFDPQGRLLVCETGVRVSRTEPNGDIVTIAERFEGRRLNSPNDIVVRSDGHIYFSDPTYGMRTPDPNDADTALLDHRSLYRIAPDGTLHRLDSDYQQPNGVALSPDEKRLYVTDSQRMDIRVYDLLPDGGVANGRLFAVVRQTGVRGAPDGLKTDVQGNVYTSGPGAVWVFSPEGDLLGKIPVPEVPTNVAFGGPGHKDLFITAQTSLYRVRVKNPGTVMSGQRSTW